MAESVAERCTLVRAFAEFEMLPDLLVRTSGTPTLFGVRPSIQSDEEASARVAFLVAEPGSTHLGAV